MGQRIPPFTFSVLKHDNDHARRKKRALFLGGHNYDLPRRRHAAPTILPGAKWVQRRWGTSYGTHGIAWAKEVNDQFEGDTIMPENEPWHFKYKPGFLDDPAMWQTSRKTVKALTRTCFRLSLIHARRLCVRSSTVCLENAIQTLRRR